MIARRYETIVGIFVVASLAALLVMVLIVAQQEGLFQEYVNYRTIFKNVSGLKPGSEVHLAGVTVGNVLSTAINPEGNIVVTFQVLKKIQRPDPGGFPVHHRFHGAAGRQEPGPDLRFPQ